MTPSIVADRADDHAYVPNSKLLLVQRTSPESRLHRLKHWYYTMICLRVSLIIATESSSIVRLNRELHPTPTIFKRESRDKGRRIVRKRKTARTSQACIGSRIRARRRYSYSLHMHAWCFATHKPFVFGNLSQLKAGSTFPSCRKHPGLASPLVCIALVRSHQPSDDTRRYMRRIAIMGRENCVTLMTPQSNGDRCCG